MQWIVGLWNKTKEAINGIVDFMRSEPVAESTQYITTQLAEGFKAVMTFPLTVLSMPFHAESRQLFKDTLQYNFVYYALPVLGYYGVARAPIAALLENVVGDYIFVVDMAMNVAFFRSATNAYFFNTFNNVNATMITINHTDDPMLAHCDCEESKHLRGALMSPLYYIGKTLSASALSNMPYVGFFFRYFLKPLSLGECLSEIKLSNLCNEHRQVYFATHTVSNLGMGMAALISIQGVTYCVSSMTGVTSLWLEDAMFNLLFPLMFFHFFNHPMPAHIKPGPHLDFFYPVRQGINITIEKSMKVIMPRLMDAENDGQILDKLKAAWSSLPVKATRKFLLYPQANQGLKPLAASGPVNLLLRINYDFGKDVIVKLRTLLDYEQYVKLYIKCYNWMPFVTPKSHQKFAVKILTNDPKQTRWFLERLESLLEHAQEPDRHKVTVTWHHKKHDLAQIDLQQSYYQAPQQSQHVESSSSRSVDSTKVASFESRPLHNQESTKLGMSALDEDWVKIKSEGLRHRQPAPQFKPTPPTLQSAQQYPQEKTRKRGKKEVSPQDKVTRDIAEYGFTIIDDYNPAQNQNKRKI